MQYECPKFKIGRGSCANSLHTASATTSEKAAICEGSWDLSQSTSTACTKETLVQTKRKMNLRYRIERDEIRRSEKIYKFLLQDEESNIQETPVANDEEGTGLIPTVIATIIVLIIVAAILIEHCRKMATLKGGSLISPDSRKRLASPATRRASFTAASARRRSTIMRTQPTIEEAGTVVRVPNG